MPELVIRLARFLRAALYGSGHSFARLGGPLILSSANLKSLSALACVALALVLLVAFSRLFYS